MWLCHLKDEFYKLPDSQKKNHDVGKGFFVTYKTHILKNAVLNHQRRPSVVKLAAINVNGTDFNFDVMGFIIQ